MNRNKIHLSSPGCPWPSIVLQCRFMAWNAIHCAIVMKKGFYFEGWVNRVTVQGQLSGSRSSSSPGQRVRGRVAIDYWWLEIFGFEWMNEWMDDVLSHDSVLKDILGRRQPGLMRWFLLWIMPLVQDRSLDLLTSSPACYHCAMDAPYIILPRKIQLHVIEVLIPTFFTFYLQFSIMVKGFY